LVGGHKSEESKDSNLRDDINEEEKKIKPKIIKKKVRKHGL
jgi:hypothetical protein